MHFPTRAPVRSAVPLCTAPPIDRKTLLLRTEASRGRREHLQMHTGEIGA